MNKLLLAFIITSVVVIEGQERIQLGTPITRSTITDYTPASLTLEITPNPRIQVILIGNEKIEIFEYPCNLAPCTTDTPSETLALINALNTANLTTRSLWRRVFDRLVVDFPSRFPPGSTVQ